MFLRYFLLTLIFLTSGGCFATTAAQDLETTLVDIARDSEPAVIPIMFAGEDDGGENEARGGAKAGVVGSAFLINPDGYFVTAVQVLRLYKPKSDQITAIINKRDGERTSMEFDVIDKDEKHDLALCKLKNFTAKKSGSEATDHPISSLEVSSESVRQGQLIVISGFSVGSWSPSFELGNIAATKTENPNTSSQSIPTETRALLQVSGSPSIGSNGGPVISLKTGKVIGVMLRAVSSSPLFSQLPLPLAFMQGSGIAFAAPASWVRELLARNHVTSVDKRKEEPQYKQ